MNSKIKLLKFIFKARSRYVNGIYSGIIFVALLMSTGCSFMLVTQQEIDTYEANGECFECRGSGHVICPQCHGRGEITCPDCSGSGKKPGVAIDDIDIMNQCSSCLGSGESNCSKCNTFRQIDCERCKGTGKAPKKAL